MTTPQRRRARLLASLHFYLALGLGWGHAMLFFTPRSLATNLDSSGITYWAIGTIIGGAAAGSGLMLKAAQSRRWQLRGLSVEMVGIIALAGGPFQYLLIQVGFMVEGQFSDRYALGWFAYAMIAALAMRIVAVVPDFIAEATDERKKKRAPR